MYFLTSLVTTLTCGFGGASVRKAEAAGLVDLQILKMHSWTAMTAFLLSLILAYYSFRIIRVKGDEMKNERMLMLFSLVFLLFFAATTFIAFNLR